MNNSPLNRLIAFTGLAGSGKDTSADYVAQRLGWNRYYFAKPLYEAVAAMLDTTVEDLKDRYKKELPVEGLGQSRRFLLQTLGTEWGREIVHPDLWVLLAKKRFDQYGTMVISDCRFINEAKWIKEEGGIIVMINRPNNDSGTVLSDHPSEQEMQTPEFLDMVDIIIQNISTKEKLYDLLDEVVVSKYV